MNNSKKRADTEDGDGATRNAPLSFHPLLFSQHRQRDADGEEQAVEKARTQDFDLVISDIGLPDRSGYELMRELRTGKGLRGIALSGFGMEHDVSKARAAGFSEHLTKPINFERLEEAIQNLLEPISQS